VLPLIRKLREVLDAQDQVVPLDPSRARSYAQRGENLEIRSESRGKVGVSPQPCEEATPEFAGDPVGHRQVVGPLIAARVADDDVLVIGEGPDVGLLGRQRLLTEVGRHADFPWLGLP
jgi:hypothetical protein